MDKIQMTKDELVSLVAEASEKAADKKLAEFKASIGPSNKFAYKGAASGMTDDEISKLSWKQASAAFIKAVYHKDPASVAKLKTMTEGTGSAGGFTVPQEFAAEVNRVVEDFGLVPKLARKFPMSSNVINVPRLASSVAVYWPGEATAGTASQPVFERVVLTAQTLVGLTPMSNELLADANISVVDLLIELFAEAIAGELDKQGLTGTGSPFTGILADTGVTVVTASSGDDTFTEASTPDYARTLISNIKPWALQGAAFFMHRTIWAVIQTKKTSGSGEYFASAVNPVMSVSAVQGYPNAIAGTLWGYPVYLSDKMPALSATAVSTKFIIFGNLKHLYVGDREEMGVAVSDSATIGSDNLFAANMSAVRVVTRKAIAVGLPTAFAVLKTAAS